jgi:hypothetical protein
MDNELLKGFLVMVLATTLFWSLNLNFLNINTSWLEIFGILCIIMMAISYFYSKRKK